jgi:serralysin
LHHEHHHPEGKYIWDDDVVIAELRASQGWTPEYIITNVINRFSSAAACVGDPEFNQDSIMLYEIPARWTKNGVSSPLNTEISARDRQCLVGVYRPR